MSDRDYASAYQALEPFSPTLETDLNNACIERLLRDIDGPSVLEVGCGKGLLAGRLASRPELSVAATDIIVDRRLVQNHPGIQVAAANIESLPFEDETFDTVVCTHTLEHVRDFPRAVAELRRVAGRQLLIVVPMERPYRYTFNLHLHFFPYPHSLLIAMGIGHDNHCEVVSGDLYYTEAIKSGKEARSSAFPHGEGSCGGRGDISVTEEIGLCE